MKNKSLNFTYIPADVVANQKIQCTKCGHIASGSLGYTRTCPNGGKCSFVKV